MRGPSYPRALAADKDLLERPRMRQNAASGEPEPEDHSQRVGDDPSSRPRPATRSLTTASTRTAAPWRSGHPFGDSGTRNVLTLATELREREARYGAIGICVGSGQGVALVIERA